MKITIEKIHESFMDSEMDEGSVHYIKFHQYRFKYLLELVFSTLKNRNSTDSIRVLDIGPAYQTLLIRNFFPHLQVDTLGFNHSFNQLREGERHFIQDLNFCEEKWDEEIKKYDLIIFCEVIEHLYTMPDIILARLYQSLNKGGHLIIQTPNALAIHKRIKLLFGIQPYDLLLENKMGHFREYTALELEHILKNVGFDQISVKMKNYFDNNSTALHRLFVKSEFLLPGSFRDGMTLVGQRGST